MLAKRHLLALAFVGGCLSGGTLIGFWRDDPESIPRDASLARTAERQQNPATADPIDDATYAAPVADDDHGATDDEPVSPDKTADSDSGSSLAEVLLRLEAAYRQGIAQGLAAAAPQSTPVMPQPPAAEVPAHQVTAVAVITPPAPPAVAAPTDTPRAREAETDTAPQPRLASRDDAQPRDVYMDKVQQNTNVGSAHQGDVYVIQNSVPWFPYYALQPGMRYPSSSVSNKDNPRGFTYPIDGVFTYPVELVH